MSSLHSRRPPKLEQGELRRGKHRGIGGGSGGGDGGGTLRRPPSLSGGEDSIGDAGNKGNDGKKKCCSLWRMLTSLVVLLLLAYLFVQVRFMFGAWVMRSGGSGLRAGKDATSG